jgi:histidinol-phosphatase
VSLDQSDIDLALGLADAADEITGARFRANDLTIDRKPDRTPVTDADLAVEDRIRELLAVARPDDRVAGEERGGHVGDGRTWLIDPVDGTKNFLRGVPAWGTLIALLVDGTPVLGVASAPALGRRWWASAGHGAWTSAAGVAAPWRLSVSKVDDLADAYLSTTDLNSWGEFHSRDAYLRLVDACWESRAFGDFWQHCLVAEGAMDVAAEAIVNPWDVAPLQVIVEQAGGRFTDLRGRQRHDGGSALSTNGRLHDTVLATLGPPPAVA